MKFFSYFFFAAACAGFGWLAYPWLRPPNLAEKKQVAEAPSETEVRAVKVEKKTPALQALLVPTPKDTPSPAPSPDHTPVEQRFNGLLTHTSEAAGFAKLYEGTLPLTGNTVRNQKERAFREDLLKLTIHSGDWIAYRALLQRSIQEALDKNVRLKRGRQRYESVWEEPILNQALLQWKLLGLFSPADFESVRGNAGPTAFLSELLNSTEKMEEVLITLQPEDRPDQIFPLLVEAWCSHDGDQEIANKYFNLALACAAVFENPVKLKNPDSSGSDVQGLERYRWYIKQNEAGRTEAPIDRSSARDLCFVVCSPVSTAELEWAAKKFRSLSRRNWGENYGLIEYLMERAVNGLNPYEKYTLPQILEHGGICGDQTYFCVNTARALGIPAFGLSGVTDSGPHAWAAVKIQPDEWTTQIGRIGGVSKGGGRDPQTGGRIDEQTVWNWNEKKFQRRDFWVKVQQHFWLADFYATGEEALIAVQTAWDLAPELPEIWQRAYEHFAATGKYTTKDWEKFAASLRREFRQNPRMASLANTIEEEHLFPKQEINEIRRSLARERRRIERRAEEQSDLMVELIEREISWITEKLPEAEQVKEITRLYEKSLREYASSITAFRSLAQAYFDFAQDDSERAEEAVNKIASVYEREVETGSDDWFRAKTEADIHLFIAELYRKIGKEKEADRIKRKIEREMKRSKRKAL